MTDIYYDSVISEYGDACAALQEEINTLRARAEKAEADCAAVIVDTARELGCFADNEGIFAAIATLQADYKRAEAELKAMRNVLERVLIWWTALPPKLQQDIEGSGAVPGCIAAVRVALAPSSVDKDVCNE